MSSRTTLGPEDARRAPSAAGPSWATRTSWPCSRAGAGPGCRPRRRCRPRPGCRGAAARRVAAAGRASGPAPRPRRRAIRGTAGSRTTNSLPCPARRCGPRPCRRASRPGCGPGSGRSPGRPAHRSSAWSAWTNISKMLGQHLRRDPDAVSRTRHDGLARPPATVSAMPAARVGVLGGVVQQVPEDLLQPGRVGLQNDRLAGSVTARRVPCLDRGRHRLDGLADDRRQVDDSLCSAIFPPVMRRRPSGRRPGRAGGDLRARPSPARPRRLPDLSARIRCRGVADRGQRVAQLVGEHGEELVLAAVGLLQVGRQRAADCRPSALRSVTSWLTVAKAIGWPGGVRQASAPCTPSSAPRRS